MIDNLIETEVDGITTLHTAGRSGLVTAGLLFRVGRADETLATAGITHLTEHLALHQHGVGDLHYNGSTADNYTMFHVQGTNDHVVEYMNSVCAALSDLPMSRMAMEKEVLRTEAAGRHGGPAPELPLWRYGAQGYGLSSYDEIGLNRVNADDVERWARTNFTRQNAMLWITTEQLPQGLSLALPDGVRKDPPPVTSCLPSTPAWFGGRADVVYMHSVVPRSTAANLAARVLSKALFVDLRQKGGYSYTATAEYAPRDHDSATVVALADCLPDKRDAVVGAFVDCLARLRWGSITEQDVESAKAAARRDMEHDDRSVYLPGVTLNMLLGHPVISHADLRREIDAVTADDIRQNIELIHESALVQVPSLGLDWAGFERAPHHSDFSVAGDYCPGIRGEPSITVGKEGVTTHLGGGPVSVRYVDAAVLEVFPDGGRLLIGKDSFMVRIEPTLQEVDAGALARVDAAVDPDIVVQMPPRPPSEIPQPAADPAARVAYPASARFVLVGLVLGALFFLVGGVSEASSAANAGESAGGSFGPIVLGLGLLGGAFYQWHLMRRRLLQERNGNV